MATASTTATTAATEAPAVGVVCFRSRADLARNADSHLRAAAALDGPLIYVDNDSDDGTVEVLERLAARSGRVIVDRRGSNPGYASSVNRLFELAGDRPVLLINPDVEIPDSEAIRTMQEALRTSPRVGVVAPLLRYPGGELQPSVRRFPSVPAMLGSLRLVARLRPLERAYRRYLWPRQPEHGPGPVEWAIGAAMLIDRAAFTSVGGWDERFFLYMEDADFCRRLWRAGWEVRFEPRAELIHGYSRHSTAPGSSVVRSSARRRHFVSLARFWSREPSLMLRR